MGAPWIRWRRVLLRGLAMSLWPLGMFLYMQYAFDEAITFRAARMMIFGTLAGTISMMLFDREAGRLRPRQKDVVPPFHQRLRLERMPMSALQFWTMWGCRV